MDEFQFQLYLGKIKSLAGTKKPLRDLATEINNFATVYTNIYEYHQFLYKQQILIRTIIELSTATNPVSKSVFIILNSNLSRLVTSKNITVDQTKILIKYSPDTYYCFMPDSLSELQSIEAKVKLMDIKDWMFSTRGLPIGNRSVITESMVYLYIKSTIPNSIILTKLEYTPSEELNTHINELNTQLNIIKSQLTKEQNEHTN